MKRINGLNIPTALEDVCDPRHMALLVYDMQVGIRSQIQTGDRIVAQIAALLSAARGCGMRVVYTRHLSLPRTWTGATAFRTAMAWQRKDEPDAVTPWFLRDTPGFQIVPELAPEPDDAVFDKLAMSAFEGTPLAFALRDCGIVSVAIAGIATEVGIEPTARHAADIGFIPVILADACGAGNEAAAGRSLESLRFAGDSIISDVETVTGLWKRGREGVTAGKVR
jgi:nicotinamidase-related amidase